MSVKFSFVRLVLDCDYHFCMFYCCRTPVLGGYKEVRCSTCQSLKRKSAHPNCAVGRQEVTLHGRFSKCSGQTSYLRIRFKQYQNCIGIGGVVSELIPYLNRKTQVMFEINKTKTGLLFSNKMVTT